MNAALSSAEPAAPWLELSGSRDLANWLTEQRVSLGWTTYRSGKVFLAGVTSCGQLSVFERTFNRCMGLWGDGQTLWMSSLYQIWRFENALRPGELHQGHDRLYVPRVGYTTGDLDVHDLAVEADGHLVFANTRFSCVATLSERLSFTPLWHPPFISKLAPDDRCHLNGLALEDGICGYVTVCSASDDREGWRARRGDGGQLLRVPDGAVIVDGLSMPHSPRVYRGQVWLLNSGTGYFGTVDLRKGQFEPVTFCPGYLRGLTFTGDYAVVTVSKPRQEKSFRGLQLNEELARHHTDARCGVLVIELRTGTIVHTLGLEGTVRELYETAVLPGVRRPMALGFKTNEIERILAPGEENCLTDRWGAGLRRIRIHDLDSLAEPLIDEESLPPGDDC